MKNPASLPFPTSHRSGTRLRYASLVLLSAVAMLGACGDSEDSVSDQRPVTITLLTHDSFVVSDGAFTQFETERNVTVRIIKQGDAGGLVNQAVLTKDNPIGDVIFGVDNTFLARALDGEIYDPYQSAAAAYDVDALGDLLDPDGQGTVTPVDYGDVCVNYDKEWFAEEGVQPPTSLLDLAQPQYEGLLTVENPASSSPGLAFLLSTRAAFGDEWLDYWERLVANDVLAVSGWEEAYNSEFTAGGGNGDRPIVVSYASSPPADVIFSDPPRRKPRIAVLADGCFRQVEYAGVLKGSDHGQDARALVDFMVSESFQESVAPNMFVFPARVDVELPIEFERFAIVPDDPARVPFRDIAAGRDDWIDAWTDVVLP